MTISSTTNKAGPFDGNDSTTNFPFTFKVFDEADLTVIYTDSDGAETTLTITTDYTVNLNADQDADPGGSIDYPVSGSPLATGDKLTVVREVDALQETDLTNGGAWYPQVVEDAIDRCVMLAQQNAEAISRALTVDVSSGLTGDYYLTTISTAVTAAQTAQTGAETAQTGAETAQTGAETAQARAVAAAGAVAFKYQFSSTTTMGDPGAGKLRFNNATLSAVTAIAIDDASNDSGNPDISAFINSWDDYSAVPKGHLVIKKSGSPSTFAIFTLTGLTDNTGWTELALNYITGNGTFSADDDIYIYFIFKGADGADAAPFSDTLSLVEGSSDDTKELRIEVDGITTSTIRVWTAQDLDLTVAGIDVVQAYTAAQRGSITTLTAVSNVFTADMDDGNFYAMTIDGSDTLANPTNLTAGQSGVVYVYKTSSGDSLAYGTYWPSTLDDFSGMAVGETGAIYYSVIDSTHIDASTKYPVGP